MATRSLVRLGVASLLGALVALEAAPSEAATGSNCNPTTLTCTHATAPLRGAIRERLPTVIDSGVMEKSGLKIQAKFTVEPVQGQPLVALDMPAGAVVEASWSPEEKGSLSLRALTDERAQAGTMDVRFTLIPSLSATLFGVTVNRDATQLLQKIPGAAINYDSQTSTSVEPWGFAGAAAAAPAPLLDNSTLFSMPLSDLGLSSGTAVGTLGIQAAAKPTFNYVTKSIQFDSASLTSEDGSAKIAIGDADAVDVNTVVIGEVSLTGKIDIRPVVKVTSIGGIPTFGLTTYSFSVASKSFDGGPAAPVQFDNAQIHIPLPNVKVPTTPISVGSARAGEKVEKSVKVDNTGELGGVLRIESSNPQFVVPAGEVRVDPKGSYELKIAFQPKSDGPATSTITVRSNDPDSPEQTFRVAANGASLGDESDDEDDEDGSKRRGSDGVESSEGCSMTARSSGMSSSGVGVLLALGLVLARRRR